MKELKIRDASFDPKKVVDPGKDSSEYYKAIQSESFVDLVDDNPDWLFLTSLIDRPGFEEFSKELESTYFQIDTEKNFEFQIILTVWVGLRWATLIFPDSFEIAAREIASKHGLVIKMARRFYTLLIDNTPCLGSLDIDDDPHIVEGFPIPLQSNTGVVESTKRGIVGAVISTGDQS
jgi:hypothetical protein